MMPGYFSISNALNVKFLYRTIVRTNNSILSDIDIEISMKIEIHN